jgi:tricorn protease
MFNVKTRSTLLAAWVTLAAGMVEAQVAPNPGMMRWPAVSRDSICFVYANDIWIAPKTGGMARPLASPPGQEQYPRFSHDGKSIAYVGNYEGNRDLYTIPVDGGLSRRVTYSPAAETLAEWTPDGDLLFITNAYSGLQRQSQLWRAPAAGGQPSKLPVPYGGFGSISPDGTWLAYTPHSVDNRTWKRYRGGMATDVWLYNLKDHTSRRITDWEGVDTLPMWVPGGDGKAVYYHSDQGPEHRMNIWSYTVATGARAQVTSFASDDVRWPSIGPGSDGRGEIVFQLGTKLMLLNLGTGQAAEVSITVPGDRPKVRPRVVDTARVIGAASISPSAKRVVIEGRGDLWSAPVKEGVVRSVTRTDGVAERDPAWSPDGKWIAYFSDEGGEYQLWVRPSDARPPEEKKDDKKGEAKKEGADGAAPPPAGPEAEKKPEPKPQPRKVSDLGPGYRYNPQWSPDSKWIAFTDAGGRLFLTDVEKGTTQEFDIDPWMNQVAVSWSGDSQWMAYAKGDDATSNGTIWIGSVKTGEKRQVTSAMFSSGSPAFDRKGDWLFFTSQRAVNNPEYSDLDNTYAYRESSVLLMAPLRKDVKSPWLPKSEEEVLKKEDEKKDEGKKDDAKKDEKKDGDDKPGEKPAADSLSGTWTGTIAGPAVPGGQVAITVKLEHSADGTLSGSITSMLGETTLSGTYDKATGRIEWTATRQGEAIVFKGEVRGGEITGEWSSPQSAGTFTLTRGGGGGGGGEATPAKKADDKVKEVKIDFEGLERRAVQLPLGPGNFGRLAVADGEKLIFARFSGRGSGDPATIKVYNYADDEKEEKAVTQGGNFELSADGKKLLVFRGGSNLTVVDASAGGGKAQSVVTAGMTKEIQDPRVEWRHIVHEAWRLQRDFFYEPTMHGVDWPKVREHYLAMVEDAASREDVNFIIAEMISELNIGHAYLGSPGDIEDQPSQGVGLLGADFALETGPDWRAYRIARIIEGAQWDSDARGPLSQPGVGVKEGEYLLAVNGVPVDTSRDPYAALGGTADRVTSLTISSKPVMDGTEREVLVKPLGSEAGLRYRAWIESKRKYVEDRTDGKVGYIYVPNTGVDGQNDLYRQFFGQRGTQALIIDERWNGGGQIPNRFIELLNRPNTNFWARRDGNDWPWPPDAHFGPKCMLINGLAGSGGDMFPWLFRHHKLGPLIGTRTWGGLVGISGNPRLLDGGTITVPTFGFYETDGTWGVEGHGVDPDIEVIDDPALMRDGADPQLDRAIAEMLKAIKDKPYIRPKRPTSPDRSGMGLPEQDR